jgi:single-stranded-DNA-specific exonuclease
VAGQPPAEESGGRRGSWSGHLGLERTGGLTAGAAHGVTALVVAGEGETLSGSERVTEPGILALVAELSAAMGISHTAATILVNKGLHLPAAAREFLKPRLSQLTSPELMADRGPATNRLAEAIRKGERICVFGDYDCDGITSAAIMTHALRALGATVAVQLANRFEGGYGVSAAAVARIQGQRPSLVVTCDCGSSDAESLRVLARSNIESIVIDHHLVPSEPLPAVAFLNPRRPDCGFAYKNLASCGLALSVVAALRTQLKASIDLHAYLDLVAIGTVADVAPLDGDNRIMVRAGLERMANSARPGLRMLFERARIESGARITGEDIAFRIAPRLNAPGRMAAPDLALELLLAEDESEAERLADEFEQLQKQRRHAQANMFEEACQDIEANGWQNDHAIVVGRETWSTGIVGILAGKLTEHYGLPVIAIALEGQVGRGSVRAPKGVPLYDSLSQIADCLLRFGGHQAAAGLDVHKDQVSTLRERFSAVCLTHSANEQQQRPNGLSDVTGLDERDDVLQVARDLTQFEPCGEGNRQPRLLVQGKLLAARAVRGGHLQIELLTARGQSLRAFGLGLGEQADSLPSELGIVGAMRLACFRSVERAEMRIEQLVTDGNSINLQRLR